MKRILQISLILFTAIAIPGQAETGQAPDSAAVGRGLALYETNCVQCHQAAGAGENIPLDIRHPDFIPAMPLNEKAHAWHHGDAQLVQMIQRGNTRMPAFSNILTEAELHDLVAYMKSLWSPRIIACQGPKHMACM